MPHTNKVVVLAEKYMPKAERRRLEKEREKLEASPPKPWSSLYNAQHIDTILAHMKEAPKLWAPKDADGAVCNSRHAQACAEAWVEARSLDRYREWDSARCSAWLMSSYVAIDAISALVAWDSSGIIMGYAPSKLQQILSVETNNYAGILLLPALIVLADINQNT